MPNCLTQVQITEALSKLDGWQPEAGGQSIAKQYRFENFSVAWAFMSRVALLAEKLDHHPDWSNSYSSVEIRLTSHDSGGVTQRDIRMARAIDDLKP